MGYTDLFSETWKAFTDYPIIRLHEYDKKRVTMFHYRQYTYFKEHCGKIEYDTYSYFTLSFKSFIFLKYRIIRNFSEGLILALLARLFGK